MHFPAPKSTTRLLSSVQGQVHQGRQNISFLSSLNERPTVSRQMGVLRSVNLEGRTREQNQSECLFLFSSDQLLGNDIPCHSLDCKKQRFPNKK